MNLALQPSKASIRWKHGILYSLLLLAVPVSLPLGMVAAAMGAWFAIQGGSLMYLPLGLVVLLAGLVIVRSHSISDFVVLVLLALATIGWSISGSETRSWLLSSVVELSGRIELLLGFLVIMVAALLIVYSLRNRPLAGPAGALGNP